MPVLSSLFPSYWNVLVVAKVKLDNTLNCSLYTHIYVHLIALTILRLTGVGLNISFLLLQPIMIKSEAVILMG
jgi:hypothetical protein